MLQALTLAALAVLILGIAAFAFVLGIAVGTWIADPSPMEDRDPPIPGKEEAEEELPAHVNEFLRLSVYDPKPRLTH